MPRIRPSLPSTAPALLLLTWWLLAMLLSLLLLRYLEHTGLIPIPPFILIVDGNMVRLALLSGVTLAVLAVFALPRAQAYSRQWHSSGQVGPVRESGYAGHLFRIGRGTTAGLVAPDLLYDRLGQAIARAERHGGQVCVVLLEADRGKFCGEMVAQEVGERVLRAVAARLPAEVRRSDSVTRLGDDAFMLLLPDATVELLAETVLHRIMDAVTHPVTIGGHALVCSCSIGVVVYPGDGADVRSLVDHAAVAVARARAIGGHCYQFYSPALHQRALEHAHITADLRQALERGQFELHYQPQIDLVNRQIVAMETSLHWRHAEGGQLSSTRLMALAESLHLMGPIGIWMLRTACQQRSRWQQMGLGQLRVGVRLPATLFAQHEVQAALVSILEEADMAPRELDVELCDQQLLADSGQGARVVQDLKAIGAQVSVAEVGIGCVNLAYLKHLPIGSIKIAPAFVRDVITDGETAMMAVSVIALAHRLGRQVAADGIETTAQLEFVRRHGCERAQGSYFSLPLPAEGFEALLQQRKSWPMAAVYGARQQTLLIVDDETNVAASLQRLLRKEHFAVLVVETASAALETLALHPVQVILCDQRMPMMTGVQFFGQVKHLYPDTIRLMLTGYTELDPVIDAINVGAVHRFFTKPWDDELLRSHIREAFRQYWLKYDAQRVNEDELPARCHLSRDATVV